MIKREILALAAALLLPPALAAAPPSQQDTQLPPLPAVPHIRPDPRPSYFDDGFNRFMPLLGEPVLWSDQGMEGFRARYRIMQSPTSRGGYLVRIDVDSRGRAVATTLALGPYRQKRDGTWRATIRSRVSRVVPARAIGRFHDLLDRDGFFTRAHDDGRGEYGNEEAREPAICIDAPVFLIEVHDARGYHSVVRDGCTVFTELVYRDLTAAFAMMSNGKSALGERGD